MSADSKYHKCECWLNIHSICVLIRVAGCWHFLLVLLSLKWSAQLLDLDAMRRLYFSLHVQEQKALYVQTWRLINVLDWCQIHSINLNQVCFSEIQQLVGIHWKEIRSELRDNGTPPVQLKKASRGTNLQLLPVNFQSYILVCEVLPVKPKVLLYFTCRTCRTGGMHSVFLTHDQPLLLELVDTKEDVRVALLLMPLWPSPTIPEPWPPCVSDILSSSEQATHIQCQSSMFQFQKFLVWLHQKLIVVLWISIIKDWQVILWDPLGAKPLTIRLVVFLLQTCSLCWWYKNSNRCCITDSSNFWSSWVLIPRENIGSKTTCFLNASIQQILMQDNETIVQGSQYGQYL